jgi:hypothetical protein
MADVKKSTTKKSNDLCSQSIMIPQIIQFFKIITDFPKLAEKLSFGLTDMKILSDQKIFCRSEKKVPKNSVACIMFSLAFLE